ncbi:hypothetical protein TNIN_167821 [Trichonephila inaurata madagascariensis]|uniref:Uncharacterized protein n=1 Tax=Trichonephila inaurata madagascariensis TaxID=2747483 RepID=A0A8X6WPB5_9ARAC|nr:hypothetical protein TNIN_167821 [Trichonephila inaurata madagascariensis]
MATSDLPGWANYLPDQLTVRFGKSHGPLSVRQCRFRMLKYVRGLPMLSWDIDISVTLCQTSIGLIFWDIVLETGLEDSVKCFK